MQDVATTEVDRGLGDNLPPAVPADILRAAFAARHALPLRSRDYLFHALDRPPAAAGAGAGRYRPDEVASNAWRHRAR